MISFGDAFVYTLTPVVDTRSDYNWTLGFMDSPRGTIMQLKCIDISLSHSPPHGFLVRLAGRKDLKPSGKVQGKRSSVSGVAASQQLGVNGELFGGECIVICLSRTTRMGLGRFDM